MLFCTRQPLFVDITKHILVWLADLSITPDSVIQNTLSALPKCQDYQIRLSSATVEVVAIDDDEYPYGFTLAKRDLPLRDKAIQFSTADATAQQIAQIITESSVVDDMPLQHAHFGTAMTYALMRHVGEDLRLTLHFRSSIVGLHLGIVGKTRTGRAVVNEGFDYPIEMDSALTPNDLPLVDTGKEHFFRLHYLGKGNQDIVYMASECDLEAVLFQGRDLSYLAGQWPYKAFTALCRGDNTKRPGLALKTPKGWIVLLHDSRHDSAPFYVYRLPDAYKGQYGISNGMYLGSEMTQLLLASQPFHVLTH